MRRIILLFSAFAVFASAKAQTVATFETLSLAHADTFYTNFTASGTDVGFSDGLAYFPCVFDTSWGGFWEQGFTYSNMTDSVTSGFMNQYSAMPAIGHSGSANYAVAYCYNPATFGTTLTMKLTDTALGHPVKGFYITNNTYAYRSMKDGDGFARKFHNGDYFMLTVKGYYHGVFTTDSVGFYLANFLHPDSNDNYIVNTWEWLNLEPLGKVDSLQFSLSSTDNSSFGMNTPAYFCMDDFTTYESFDTSSGTTSAHQPKALSNVKVYPNPTKNTLHIELTSNTNATCTISNIAGQTVNSAHFNAAAGEINTSSLQPGVYLLQVISDNKMATIRFVKE